MTRIPDTEPAYIQAGDTLAWRRTLPDYPASAGWTLSYRLINATGKIDIAASADGDAHLVSVAASVTASWSAGAYKWTAHVVRGAERYTVGSGDVVIKPDLAAQPSGVDARSEAERALADLRSALLTWIATSGQVQSYTIAGRTMTYRSMAEIRRAISLAEREVAREKAAERLAQGLDAGRRVLVRF